jgi:CRP/FNR family cyclic AMP-dependent transcriptional regulator
MLEREPISLADACQTLACEGWLATMAADFRDTFLAVGHLRTFASGDQISTAGDDAEVGPGMYGVAAGQVAIMPALGAPDAPVSLLFNPGSWGGYAPLFGWTRVAHLRAITPTSILCVSLGEVRRMLNARPDWWQHFAQLSFEAGMTYATIAVDLLILRADRRLAAMLLHQANCRHAGQAQPIYLSQEEVGETARLSRHPTRHLLRAFQARGWLSQSYRSVRILAPEQLRALADSDERRGLSL